ncbi:MAG TPA: hypothetical protein VIX15_04950 [Streptosporangiaceae bacterium]
METARSVASVRSSPGVPAGMSRATWAGETATIFSRSCSKSARAADRSFSVSQTSSMAA